MTVIRGLLVDLMSTRGGWRCVLSKLGGQFAVGNHHGEAIVELLMDEWFADS